MQDSAANRRCSRFRFRFGLRNLLLLILLSAFVVAWWTGRIGFPERRSAQLAAFGNDLVVFEWEVPDEAQACYLRIDGKRRSEIDPANMAETKFIRLAVVELDDTIQLHLQAARPGSSTSFKRSTSRSVDVSTRRSFRGRHVELNGPTQLYQYEELDAESRVKKEIALILE